MKILIIITLLFSLQLKAGQEGGGGGHPCKSDFMQIYRDIRMATFGQGTLRMKHGALNDILTVFDKGSMIKIEVLDKKIRKCKLAKNPMACSKPQENIIQLYCGKDGWLSQSSTNRILTVMHELLWWSPTYDDSNYYYSSAIFEEIKPIIKKQRLWDYNLNIVD